MNNRMNSGYEKYTPTLMGRLAIGVTAPSAIISFISVVIALFGLTNALIVTFFSFIISFIGCIAITVDIVMFNVKQKKKNPGPKSNEPKELDIMRIVHMVIGMFVGVIIGYLIWGNK